MGDPGCISNPELLCSGPIRRSARSILRAATGGFSKKLGCVFKNTAFEIKIRHWVATQLSTD